MNESSPERMDSCIYEIDDDDRIVSCNAEWDHFALANGGDDIVFREIIGKVLWNYVTDPSSADLYRRLVAQVRDGRSVKFRLRCDSSEMLRLVEMRISKTDTGRVRFAARVKALEPRNGEFISAANTSRPVLVCSWCGRVDTDDQVWHDVEVAVSEMRIFERPYPPMVSHGICPECYSNITEVLQRAD